MTGDRVASTEALASTLDQPATLSYGGNTEAYLASADRMIVVADWTMKVCIALIVLVLAAWALGVLPGAIRLF